ncbi:MAG: carbohydrate ABC transporter substrate-binding protein, partial [Ruminococcus sp.]|nr:carbohydrate ABC transporter substrate-binding protein [Ruminococcus sp.]
MKKRILTAVLSVAMIASLAACTGTTPAVDDSGAATTPAPAVDGGGDAPAPAPSGKTVINMYAFTDEVPGMWDKYVEVYPEIADKYELKATVIATTDGLYEPALDQALAGGAGSAPDIYAAEAAFVLKYTKYDAAGYAAPYKDLGIDVENLITAGDIAAYSVDIGRNQAGDVVGLGYQAVGGCAIYRSSIAKEVFGTDDPATIGGIIGPGFDKFFEAAETLKAAGYKIVSGDGDVWHLIENSSP